MEKWIGNEEYQFREEEKYRLEVQRKNDDLWHWQVKAPMGDKYEGYRPSMATAKHRAVEMMKRDEQSYKRNKIE